jgi:hypothetical protein
MKSLAGRRDFQSSGTEDIPSQTSGHRFCRESSPGGVPVSSGNSGQPRLVAGVCVRVGVGRRLATSPTSSGPPPRRGWRRHGGRLHFLRRRATAAVEGRTRSRAPPRTESLQPGGEPSLRQGEREERRGRRGPMSTGDS